LPYNSTIIFEVKPSERYQHFGGQISGIRGAKENKYKYLQSRTGNKRNEALRKAHLRTSFIFIYHTTKEGRFKGSNTHAHEVDVIIQVEQG
jgi:hypothetical protein